MKQTPVKHVLLFSIVIALLFLQGCISFETGGSGIRSYSAREHAFVQFRNQKERDTELEAQFDRAIEQYGGSGKYIIDYMKMIADTYCSTPYIAYYSWIGDRTREKVGERDFMFNLVSDVSTAIHETAHGFCSSAAYMDSSYTTSSQGYLSYSAPARISSVYLEDWGVQHILQTPTVPSEVISDLIVNKEIMEDQRFITYVSPSTQYQSTQLEGIYGLLDEYHAYYYSLIATRNKALDTSLDSSYEMDGSTYYLSSFNDIYLSYLQFSTYILTYIRTVEAEYPQVYNDIMDNELLLEAIIRIHDAFEIEYNQFVELIYSDVNGLNKDPFEEAHTSLKAEYMLPENQQMLVTIRSMVESF